jgi:hypothetical protein
MINRLDLRQKCIAMVSRTRARMYQTLEITVQTQRTQLRGVGINKPTQDFSTAALCVTFSPAAQGPALW